MYGSLWSTSPAWLPLVNPLNAVLNYSGMTFLRLLLLWRGSVWKHVLFELLLWSLGCISLAMIYLTFIKEGSPDHGDYCKMLAHLQELPFKSTLSLLLGFTAQITMKRWMDVYWLLVWPENAALMFNAWFRDDVLTPQKARIVRHSVYRYLLLVYILVLRDVSIPVKNQFPTYNHLIEGNLLTEEELDLMEHANIDPNYCRYWIPMLWVAQVIKKQYRSQMAKGRTAMDHVLYGKLVSELARVRGTLGDILSYDWIPIPLAHTQTITFAVYCYLLVDGVLQHYPLCVYDNEWSVMGWVARFAFSLLLNTFYLGWLKCSLVMVNPFGLDDDDYEAGSLIDMYQRSLAAILTRPERSQPVAKHAYRRLPHTVGSALAGGTSETSLVGSMAHKIIPDFGQERIRKRLRKPATKKSKKT